MGRLSYQISGGDDSVLLMMAGYGRSGSSWLPWLDRVGPLPLRVVLVDHRGTGESARTARPFSVATLADGRLLRFNPTDVRFCMGARALAAIGDRTSQWHWHHCARTLVQTQALSSFDLRYWSLMLAGAFTLASAFGFALALRFDHSSARVVRGRQLLTGLAARRAFVGGQFEAARTFMLAFQRAIWEVLRSESVWTFMQAAMRSKYGIEVGLPRPPLSLGQRPWQEADVERLIASVDNAFDGAPAN